MCISTLGTFASAAQRALRAPSAPRIFADNLRAHGSQEPKRASDQLRSSGVLVSLVVAGRHGGGVGHRMEEPVCHIINNAPPVNTRAKRD